MKKVKRLAVIFVTVCMVLSFVMPSYAVESFAVQGANAINAKTIEVQFNADVDQTLAVNVGNYAVRETYGAQTVFPVASASMKLDDSGNVIGNTVILKLASATAINIYTVTVSNITASDGTLLAADKDNWTFVGTNLNTPEDQDATLQALAVSAFIVNGSNTAYATWYGFDVDVPQTGVTGYEIYYMKKADLGNNALTKDTTGATKVVVEWASTQYTQLNIDGDAKDYKFVIYAVNGRTYSMPSYSATHLFYVEYAYAVNSKTIEVGFNVDVDQTLAGNVANYVISEEFGEHSAVPVVSACVKTDGNGNVIGNAVILKLANATIYDAYSLTVANITDSEGTPIDSNQNKCVFGGSTENSQDMELQSSSVSDFNVSGSGMVNATWTPFNSDLILDTGVTGYEIYYIKRADLGFQSLTQATLGTSKVVAQGASTSSVQVDLSGNISDYAFVIYAVNDSTYSLPKYFPDLSFAMQSAIAIDTKTIEVYFSADVDQTLAVNIANYKIQEMYGMKLELPVASASMKLDASGNVVGNTVVLKLSSAMKASTLYGINVINVTAVDGTPLGLDKSGCIFGSSTLNPPEDLAIQAAGAIDTKTIEVYFSADVDQTLALNVANYKIQEMYGTKLVLPVANASMKLDASGNVVGYAVVLKLSSAMKASTLYGLNVINVTTSDGIPLGVDKNSCTFVGSGLNTPEEQDAILPTLKVSGLAVSGSGAVDITWTAFDLSLVPQTGVTGYELYYIKKADLTKKKEKEKQKVKEKKMDFFTKDTLGATKVAVDGVSTSSIQLNLEGSTDDYMFIIYAVNGRVCSMRATLSVLEPKAQSKDCSTESKYSL